MNVYAMAQAFPDSQEPTSVPLMYDGPWLRTPCLWQVGAEQWDVRVTADQLAGLASVVTGARRGLVAGAENEERGRVLREDPESFGV
ncbi:hypothetical protein K353_02604 [Kitasatospora sp. SolWspMP-SS2h]|uniref:hypothetical protein n=1 Tax=Kitasatospora sp. SolWspMP-SS2h TaxID=1305729 RepID=UPI000DBA759C|nr:hypothetical protein [Kitasatospora sp. SolWspMP-SS2h]RAJ42253.1 hypothetical protein K353_02604 [Kitasatospora sp. SolWspMP-SS2h]